MTTNEQCLKNAVDKLEVDSKLKRQQFGNQTEIFSETAKSPDSKPKTERKADPTPVLKGGIFLAGNPNSLSFLMPTHHFSFFVVVVFIPTPHNALDAVAFFLPKMYAHLFYFICARMSL